MSLNPKQVRFVREYVIDLCATSAAQRAGYSKKSAYAQGCALLKHPEVKRAIDARLARSGEKLGLTQERIIKMLEEGAAEAREVGQLGPYAKMTELLGKHIGMFRERVEISGKDGGAIEVTLAKIGELARAK